MRIQAHVLSGSALPRHQGRPGDGGGQALASKDAGAGALAGRGRAPEGDRTSQRLAFVGFPESRHWLGWPCWTKGYIPGGGGESPYVFTLTDANVTKREGFEPRRLRSDANVTKREVFQRRTPGGGVLGRLRRCESWAFAGSVTAWSGPCRRKLRVLLHLQHGDGPAGPYLRVLLQLHHATPHRAGCGA